MKTEDIVLSIFAGTYGYLDKIALKALPVFEERGHLTGPSEVAAIVVAGTVEVWLNEERAVGVQRLVGSV